MNKARITIRLQPDPPKHRNPSDAEHKVQSRSMPQNEQEYAESSRQLIPVPISKMQERDADSVQHEFIEPLNQFVNDYGAWESPFDAETERIERLIRESENEQNDRRVSPGRMEMHDTDDFSGIPQDDGMSRFEERDPFAADHGRTDNPEVVYETETEQTFSQTDDYDAYASQPPADRVSEQFYPVIEEEDSYKYKRRHNYARHTRPPWMKILMSITGAIVTGVAFGFIVLNMFSNHSESVKTMVNSIVQQPDSGGFKADSKQPVNNADGASGSAGATTKSANGMLSVYIPPASFTLMQAGAYSSVDAAEAEVAKLQNQGHEGYLQHSDKYYVYTGVADNHNDALPLSQRLQDDKVDIYLKDEAFPAVKTLKWSGLKPMIVQNYFSMGNQLVMMLSALSAQHLAEKIPTAESASSLKTLQDHHQSWTQSASLIQDGVPASQRSSIQTMNKSLNTAIVTLTSYQSNPSISYLQQIQTSLLQFIFTERELYDALTNS